MLNKLRKLARKNKNGNVNGKNNGSKHRLNGRSNGSPTSGIKGYLTNDDLERLEEASKRVLKYPKQYVQKYKCAACSYEWLYNAIKCPVCSAADVKKIG